MLNRGMWLIALVMALVGCHRLRVEPGSPAYGLRIQVREFDITRTRVSSYDAPIGLYGFRLAEKIAEKLRAAGASVEAIRRDTLPMGQLIIDGEITTIEGGSGVARFWLPFAVGAGSGIGAARLVVRGEMAEPSQVLGRFFDERWSSASEGSELVEVLLEITADDIAEMVVTGRLTSQSRGWP